MSEEEINREDEIVTLRLPRKDADIVRQMIKERETMNNITAALKSSFIWVVVAGALGCWALWDKFKGVI